MQSGFTKTPSDEKWFYPTNFKKSLAITLLFFNLVIWFSPQVSLETEEVEISQLIIDVENIPATRQTHVKPPPPLPKIPVPSEDATIPEDLTIEETTLTFTSRTAGLPDPTGVAITPPKLVHWASPEMPKEEKKKGINGVVKLSVQVDQRGEVVEAIVIDNTTNSDKCAQAALEAAYSSRFFPAREGNKPVTSWSSISYGFNSDN